MYFVSIGQWGYLPVIFVFACLAFAGLLHSQNCVVWEVIISKGHTGRRIQSFKGCEELVCLKNFWHCWKMAGCPPFTSVISPWWHTPYPAPFPRVLVWAHQTARIHHSTLRAARSLLLLALVLISQSPVVLYNNPCWVVLEYHTH